MQISMCYTKEIFWQEYKCIGVLSEKRLLRLCKIGYLMPFSLSSALVKNILFYVTGNCTKGFIVLLQVLMF